MTAILEARGVKKHFVSGGDSVIEVLSSVDLTVGLGEVVAVVGASGTGKSTLLHLLGALDVPTAGEILVDGRSYSALSESERDVLRNQKIGFVFQFHHLLREFSALENVMMPLLIGGASENVARGKAEKLLAEVGLTGRMTHRPAKLSGGEQQRCAVARALAREPSVVLADEPSGNLDNRNSELLHDLLFDLAKNLETAMVVVTHNNDLAKRCDRVLLLENGLLQSTDPAGVLP
jgi:lipoprotein-releasing system ATP-binding protein